MTYPQGSSSQRYEFEPFCPIVVCDADQWLRRMRLPADALTHLLRMPLGGEMVLFEFYELSPDPDGAEGVASARMERYGDDVWRFDALWTLDVGNSRRRGSISAAGFFSIDSPLMLSWEARTGIAMRRLQRIIRLNAWLARMAGARGNHAPNNR